mgnify:CR=1 FL=1
MPAMASNNAQQKNIYYLWIKASLSGLNISISTTKGFNKRIRFICSQQIIFQLLQQNIQ